ncbi:MAG TPA: hypothetical protein VLI54_02980 [Bacillota bacterium]|nr:hypothetical protein [Bacillota bacterium]
MEQINQPRGAADEITNRPLIPADQPVAPIEIPRPGAEAAASRPPLTFEEAEAHSPFALLGELRDHATSLRIERDSAGFHLTELALSAAVVAWWSRWQPLTMHRAFLAGASLADVAAATGSDEAGAYARWSAWAESQAQLVIGGRAAMAPDELAAIRARFNTDDILNHAD